MALGAIFQGHWRALEATWLTELILSRKQGSVAVITAGQPLSKHLMQMVPGNTMGTVFLPGIPALSKALASNVIGKTLSDPGRVALAALSGYRPETAPASSAFFERLIEMGVSAGAFHTISLSTRNLHRKVLETAAAFNRYSHERNRLHPFAPDRIVNLGPIEPDRFRTYMFYGFYDLNPAQRKYVKLLCGKAHVMWFSPVHPSHYFRNTFKKTLSFLTGLAGNSKSHRVDWNVPLQPMAQFADNLLTGRALTKPKGIELIYCGAGQGFLNAVTTRLRDLGKQFRPDETAVVATGEEAVQLAWALHSAGIPCGSPLLVKASSLAAGCLLNRLLRLDDNNFHHKDIEKLLLTGAVTMTGSPDSRQYAAEAGKQGNRFGLQALQETEFPFACAVADYFHRLPVEAAPENYLAETVTLLTKLTEGNLPGVFIESILTQEAFSTGRDTTFAVFREMVAAALETQVKLTEPHQNGVAILSPEKARGILKKAIIITGLEEGVFPRPAVNDPRLPPEVKKQLQLPGADTRETEEAFLLRQVFEAAEEEITVLCRNTDSTGRPVAVSPFIAPLDRDDSPLKPVRLSDSPQSVLYIPSNAPFLESSVCAQRERLLFKPENPSPEAEHCGMVGKIVPTGTKLSATALENYWRDPFSFLMERVWKVAEVEEFPVQSEPNPLSRGTIVHRCVEKVLKDQLPVYETVREICLEKNLTALLGSHRLADIWMENLTGGIEKLAESLREREWTFLESEKELKGTIAGFQAGGRIDLIFRNPENQFILADLKTGKPKTLKNSKGITILEKGLFQLPFYRSLAVQNSFSRLNCASYIHLESNGKITFNSLSGAELEELNPVFEDKVREIVEAMQQGDFHKTPKQNNARQGR